MRDGDTNPGLVSIGHVYTAVKEMRVENKKEHKAITGEIVAQGKEIVCLQVKWGLLKWLIPISVTVAASLVGLLVKFLA